MSRLRAERERLGLTQGQIEALLWGMPHRTYQDIEAERRVPPQWVMAAIFERLAKRQAKPNANDRATSSASQHRGICRAAEIPQPESQRK